MDKKIKEGEKLWNRQYVLLLFLGTLTATGFAMVIPIIAKYAIQLGASLTVAGIIAGLFSITALVARPFGGAITDRFNKKITLVASTTVLAAATFGYSFSVNIPLLVVFRILHGSGFAVSSTADMALVTNFIPGDKMGEGIGYYGLGQVFAMAIGPNIGLIIGDAYGFNMTFLISAFVLLIAAVLMTRVSYNEPITMMSTIKQPHKRVEFKDLIATEILPLAFFAGLFSFSNGLVSSFLVLVGEKRNIKNIVLYFTLNSIFLFIIRPAAGKLADKKSLSFILYPSMILTAMESLLLSNANVLWIVLVAAVCKAFGQGSGQPSLQSACIKKLGISRSGVASSTYFIGADIGQGVAPMIGGAIASRYGYNVMFYCCAGLFIAGIIGYYFYDRNDRKQGLSQKCLEKESA